MERSQPYPAGPDDAARAACQPLARGITGPIWASGTAHQWANAVNPINGPVPIPAHWTTPHGEYAIRWMQTPFTKPADRRY